MVTWALCGCQSVFLPLEAWKRHIQLPAFSKMFSLCDFLRALLCYSRSSLVLEISSQGDYIWYIAQLHLWHSWALETFHYAAHLFSVLQLASFHSFLLTALIRLTWLYPLSLTLNLKWVLIFWHELWDLTMIFPLGLLQSASFSLCCTVSSTHKAYWKTLLI